MKNGWRFIAERLTGDGTGQFIDEDVPISDAVIEEVLTGHNSITGTITPEYLRLKGPDGKPLIDEWGTAIYAEHQGIIRGGGIVTDCSFDGPNFALECTGFTGYAEDMPFIGGKFFVETDPLDIFRYIWNHLQSKQNGNLGFEIDDTKAGYTIGEELQQVEFDTVSGPLSFEAGPYKLAWYLTHNLAENLMELAEQTPIDWREKHSWNGDSIKHFLEIGYPKLGIKRKDRYVLGENIWNVPSVDRDGSKYASEVLFLGSGEGRKMRRAQTSAPTGKLRRVAVVSDPSVRTDKKAKRRADNELAWRKNVEDVSEVVVSVTSPINVGDEIRIEGDTGWVIFDQSVRVLSKSIAVDSADMMTLTIARADQVAA